ncbi:hypothetical protein BHE74_00019840 [Ensete ventricosum]|nr:hypothetical protein GW17_00047815 [Ensete ventricosum]RWW72357.1 hypothetical protein BHE74_00019840 [Ensete ventricosum]
MVLTSWCFTFLHYHRPFPASLSKRPGSAATPRPPPPLPEAQTPKGRRKRSALRPSDHRSEDSNYRKQR